MSFVLVHILVCKIHFRGVCGGERPCKHRLTIALEALFVMSVPDNICSATVSSHSGFFMSWRTRMMSKRLSKGPDREVLAPRETLESYLPWKQEHNEHLQKMTTN